MSSSKSRYLDSHSNSNPNDRYSDRNPSSSASGAWGGPSNGPPSSVKPFSSMQSVAGNDPWNMNKPPDSNSWSRSMDHQGQDRYDRTYNERKSSSQYIDGPSVGGSSGSRPNSFITSNRPQDRYNSNAMSSRFDGGRF